MLALLAVCVDEEPQVNVEPEFSVWVGRGPRDEYGRKLSADYRCKVAECDSEGFAYPSIHLVDLYSGMLIGSPRSFMTTSRSPAR